MLISAILIGFLLIIFVPILALWLELTAALKEFAVGGKEIAPRSRVAVLIPAHNEALGIQATLETVNSQLAVGDRVVVVADNCTDKTAQISRKLNAITLERHNPQQRGKGYALAHGLSFLQQDPPDVVFVVDADCQVKDGTVEHIAGFVPQMNRPVQVRNLVSLPPQPSLKDKLSAFAFMVNTVVRPQGLASLNLPCTLHGTGMAFPWCVLQGDIDLANENLSEDMQLAVDLAVVGHFPLFTPHGEVTSALPSRETAAMEQRVRWEHGHLRTLLTQVPLLLKAGLLQRRWKLLMLALDIAIPPLSLLTMLWLLGALAALALFWLQGLGIGLLISGIEAVLLLFSIVGAWGKYGRKILDLRTLLAIPFYVLWKVPIYFGFLFNAKHRWVRTER